MRKQNINQSMKHRGKHAVCQNLLEVASSGTVKALMKFTLLDYR